ncbi:MULTISPECIES: TetR/AcrR family transcriptional regulator [Microbacterium]|uniref:TetR/AcrR family transcriptional regulator n=1 Tax=Microbacterium gilvum TaxID=1336204 RepID=A0ABP8ZRL6_9MICO
MSSHDGPGRPADAELTARILDAVVAELEDGGYAGLRIERVAARAGCGKTAIYRRYADRGVLAAAAIRRHLVLGEMPDTGSVVDDLLAHVEQNQANQAQNAARIGFSSVARSAFASDVFPHLWESFFAARRDQGVAILRRGAARGELSADADPDLILDALAGLTLYRQGVKGVTIAREEYRDVIAALLRLPPRRHPLAP